jgi:hypothetical protein
MKKIRRYIHYIKERKKPKNLLFLTILQSMIEEKKFACSIVKHSFSLNKKETLD